VLPSALIVALDGGPGYNVSLPGATLIPLPELSARLAEVPRDRPVVLNCASGSRSMIAAGLLQAHGVDRVINLIGGYSAWVKAKLPTET